MPLININKLIYFQMDQIIEGVQSESPQSMDRKAILSSLEYIKNNPNKFPKDAVIFIFTTYENNYEIATAKKGTLVQKTKDFMNNYRKLKNHFFSTSREIKKRSKMLLGT